MIEKPRNQIHLKSSERFADSWYNDHSVYNILSLLY